VPGYVFLGVFDDGVDLVGVGLVAGDDRELGHLGAQLVVDLEARPFGPGAQLEDGLLIGLGGIARPPAAAQHEADDDRSGADDGQPPPP
jgi:hypothetical protein